MKKTEVEGNMETQSECENMVMMQMMQNACESEFVKFHRKLKSDCSQLGESRQKLTARFELKMRR